MDDLDIWVDEDLPVVLNGQIMPGDVDRFRFEADRGTRLLAAVHARSLVPYLADAVPGWFQATLKLLDAQGNELAFSDDFRFDPDPVLYCEIPANGKYVIEIADNIYRGREDFVYRIVVGELPYITGIRPLGGRVAEPTTVSLQGWNLPSGELTIEPGGPAPDTTHLRVTAGPYVSNPLPFAVDDLPETFEREPNDALRSQPVQAPVIVNGTIEQPGDWDVYRFEARAGDAVVMEIRARRLRSPLDSLIKLTDADGRLLAANDDREDRGCGLVTHHADSYLSATCPRDGLYLVHVGDTQGKGGNAHSYRLRISPPRPGFRLRAVPSSIHARPGMTVPIIVHALRDDGFEGAIDIGLKDMPPGFRLAGRGIPAGGMQTRLTLTLPRKGRTPPTPLRLEGRARVAGRNVCREAVPAEDVMQAFLWRHLVAACDGMITFARRSTATLPSRPANEPIRLAPGDAEPFTVKLPPSGSDTTLRLSLDSPPEGLTLSDDQREAGRLTMLLKADASLEPGLAGNLIVRVTEEKILRDADGNPRGSPRVSNLGVLPAVPFEIVAPAAAATPPARAGEEAQTPRRES